MSIWIIFKLLGSLALLMFGMKSISCVTSWVQ